VYVVCGFLYCRFPIGKTEQVKAWEHAVVQNFWSKWYFPGNVTLYIVGDLDRPNEEVIRLIEASFGGFPAGGCESLHGFCMHDVTTDESGETIPDRYC
jgi:predicted Zn-dependent peptidase